MVTNDLYDAISALSTNVEKLVESQNTNSEGGSDSICASLDNLCAAVTESQSAQGSGAGLGLVLHALSADSSEIKGNADAFSSSVGEVVKCIDSIDDIPKDTADRADKLSTALGSIADCLAVFSFRTSFNAFLASKQIPILTGFFGKLVNAFKDSIGDDSTKHLPVVIKDTTKAIKGIDDLVDNVVSSSSTVKAAAKAANAYRKNVPSILGVVSVIDSVKVDNKKALSNIRKIDEVVYELTSTGSSLVLSSVVLAIAAVSVRVGMAFVYAVSDLYGALETTGKGRADKKEQRKVSATTSAIARVIREVALAAGTSAMMAPFAVIGLVGIGALTLFVKGANAFITSTSKLTSTKGLKDLNKTSKALAKGILTFGLAALAAVVIAPVALLGAVGMLAVAAFAALSVLAFKTLGEKSKIINKGILTLTLIAGGLLLTTYLLTLVVSVGAPLASGAAMLTIGCVLLTTGISAISFAALGGFAKPIIKGSLVALLTAGTLLGVAFMLNTAIQQGQELLADPVGSLEGFATIIGGLAVTALALSALGVFIAPVALGSVAALMTVGALMLSSIMLTSAVKAGKEILENPEDTMEGFEAIFKGVTMVAGLVASCAPLIGGVLVGSIVIGAVATATMLATIPIRIGSSMMKSVAEDNPFEEDGSGTSPFGRTLSGLFTSLDTALPSLAQSALLGARAMAVLPLSALIATMASGVSEFSKIATMKGEITTTDENGKTVTRPFNLEDVGKGISTVISVLVEGIGNAIASMGLDEGNLVEIPSGFLGLGSTKVPKQLACMQHLTPLASFVAALAEGVSKFSDLATMKGTISTVDENGKTVQRPFNLADVGKGITAVITSLMTGISQAMASFEEGGFTEIKTGGFLGIGGDTVKVPTRLVNLQHLIPLAEFVSGIASAISDLSGDNKKTPDASLIKSTVLSVSDAIKGVDVDEDRVEKCEALGDAWGKLKSLFSTKYDNLPTEEHMGRFRALTSEIHSLGAEKLVAMTDGSNALSAAGDAITKLTSVKEDMLKEVPVAVKSSVDAINDLDLERANALSAVYTSFAQAASARSSGIDKVVQAIKDSTVAMIEAIRESGATLNDLQPVEAQQPLPLPTAAKSTSPVNIVSANTAPQTSKVRVDLTINGQGGDSWVIRKR